MHVDGELFEVCHLGDHFENADEHFVIDVSRRVEFRGSDRERKVFEVEFRDRVQKTCEAVVCDFRVVAEVGFEGFDRGYHTQAFGEGDELLIVDVLVPEKQRDFPDLLVVSNFRVDQIIELLNFEVRPHS